MKKLLQHWTIGTNLTNNTEKTQARQKYTYNINPFI